MNGRKNDEKGNERKKVQTEKRKMNEWMKE